MTAPEVPIEIDEATGVWTTDGLAGAVIGEEVACAAEGHSACVLDARLAARETL
jgi:hypothetical protein